MSVQNDDDLPLIDRRPVPESEMKARLEHLFSQHKREKPARPITKTKAQKPARSPAPDGNR